MVKTRHGLATNNNNLAGETRKAFYQPCIEYESHVTGGKLQVFDMTHLILKTQVSIHSHSDCHSDSVLEKGSSDEKG